MNGALLSTKLNLPLMRQKFVPRPRLLERLNEGIREENRLILICAPAGYGKTTLLCEWHRSLNGKIPFAWLALDEDDNDPARFFIYFLAALDRIFPGRFTDLQTEILSPGISSLRVWVPNLINLFDPTEKDFVLVLDDFHLIHSTPIQDGIAYLLDFVPPCMHLVISTRRRPEFPLARLHARAQMTELTAEDLRFNYAETTSFLTQVTARELLPEDLKRLEKEIDGWAAGLQLAAFHFRQSHPPEDTKELDFSGGQGAVFDFLVEEVLRPLPDYLRDFLYRTSILERMNADLTAALTGRDDTQAILEELVESNLFTMALDEDRRWFRYHHLFSETLQHEMEHDHGIDKKSLHRLAGKWFEDRQELREGMNHYLAAGLPEDAARLLDQNASHFFMSGEIVSVLDWVDRIPDEIINRFARLRAVLVWGHFITGENIQAPDEIANIRRDYPDEIARDAILRGYLIAMESLYILYLGEWQENKRVIEDLYPYLDSSDKFLVATVKIMMGMFYFIQGKHEPSERALAESVEVSRSTGNSLLTYFSLLMMGMFHIIQGEYRLAYQFFERGFQYTEDLDKVEEEIPPINVLSMGKGEVLREWNRLDEAEVLLERSIRYGKRWGNSEFYIDAYGYLARVRRSKGDLRGAMAAIEEAEMLVHEGKVSFMTARSIGAQKARVQVLEGNWEAVEKWSDELEPKFYENHAYGMVALYLGGMEDTTLVRLMIGRGRYVEAEAKLLSMLEQFEDSFCGAIYMDLLMLLGRVYDCQNRPEEALQFLYRSLSLAEPEGLIRHYLDEGPALQDLLRRLLKEKRARPQAFPSVSEEYLATLTGGEIPDAGAEDGLSARELEVLALIGRGASNKEIAGTLSIAPSTVKTHINHLHDKLHTRSRTLLVIQARELGLIP